jgi:tetratricopeptide (TPR) repeat protein
MARRKRYPHGDRPHRRRPAKPPDESIPVIPTGPEFPDLSDVPDLPDPRASEGALHELIRPMRGDTANSSLDRAQELMYQAFRETDDVRQAEMAREALTLCPDCADAYVLLAELAPSRKKALELYQQGVAAGERALGPETFERQAGHFWGVLETRPYMRARLGLAHQLWTAARREEAVGHLQDMLRLNPNDNQGVRYTLAGFLLFLDRDGDLARLLDQYPKEYSAAWAYTRVLLAFRRHGDSDEARRLLQEAKKINKHVPAYLTGQKFPPAELPNHYSPGHETEALQYLGTFMPGWKDTLGAIAWLRANDEKLKKRASAVPQARGPLGFIRKWVREHLPQVADVWQAECRQMPNWIRVAGYPARPWVIVVTSQSQDLILAHDVVEEAPTPALLWDTLVQAMQHPAAGEPHRPSELQVRPDERWEALRGHLQDIGVNLATDRDLDEVDDILDSLNEHLGGQAEPGLLDMPGVKPEHAAGLYEAAASFFQQAPWKKVGYESAIKIECDKFHSGPWYGVLMGQSGLTSGIALYEDMETLRFLWQGGPDEENARESVATAVTFGEEWTIPVADLDASRRHGWKVARPDAYPEVLHKERGLSGRPPLAWELELMEGSLRVVPDFVSCRPQDDTTPESFTVSTAWGTLHLVLSWVDDL